METMVIDIPDFTESEDKHIEVSNSLPVSNKVIDGVEEVDIEALPENNNTADPLEIENPSKFYEKQKVKEARLKAKLALYKAQRQMNQYYEKYGDTVFDSDSDSEYESSDDESSEEED